MSTMRPSVEQHAELEKALGARITGFSPVQRGHSEAGRWIITLADGSSAFLKVGVDEPTREGIALEAFTYESLRLPGVPRVRAYVELGFGCLALEDLSKATWPPPWSEQAIADAFDLLARLAMVNPPADHRLGRLEQRRALLMGWEDIARTPSDFLDLGLRPPRWLDACLPRLTRLESVAQLDGQHVVHRDLRSDNVCFVGSECRFVDWAGTEIGNWRFDCVALMISIHADAPTSDVLRYLESEDAALLALQAGFLASRTGRPDPYPGSGVREMQRSQLRGALDLLDNVL